MSSSKSNLIVFAVKRKLFARESSVRCELCRKSSFGYVLVVTDSNLLGTFTSKFFLLAFPIPFVDALVGQFESISQFLNLLLAPTCTFCERSFKYGNLAWLQPSLQSSFNFSWRQKGLCASVCRGCNLAWSLSWHQVRSTAIGLGLFECALCVVWVALITVVSSSFLFSRIT